MMVCIILRIKLNAILKFVHSLVLALALEVKRQLSGFSRDSFGALSGRCRGDVVTDSIKNNRYSWLGCEGASYDS